MARQRPCRICGQSLAVTAKSAPEPTCRQCRRLLREQQPKVNPPKPPRPERASCECDECRAAACAGCGTALAPRKQGHGGLARKWCSGACRTRTLHPERRDAGLIYFPRCFASARNCECCDELFIARRATSRACGQNCQKAIHAARQRARYAADPDRERSRMRETRAAWSEEEREREAARAREWNRKVGYTDSKRRGDQRRRAAKLGAVTERFDAREVYERDGWRCGICSRRVKPALVWPHPMSASLDHIVPLSRHGDHTRANTRLAHLRCNIRRSNRGDAEQLALLG